MIKKALSAIFAALLIAVLVVGIWAATTLRKTLPQTSGEIELPGLDGPVEVARDDFGIPHITAQSEMDLYRALGFVNAQDRLWQMDLFRRISQGRLAEVFGPAAVKLDHKHRVLGFRRLADWLYAKADDKSKAICDAYVDGINQYIKKYPDTLPLEFRLLRTRPEEWSPKDVYNVLMWQQWMVTFNWESELAMVALIQNLGVDEALDLISIPKAPTPTIIPESEKQYAPAPSRVDDTLIPPEIDYNQIKFEPTKRASGDSRVSLLRPVGQVYASNAWAVSGARSASGKPILCNDPHVPHTLPSIWYIVRLSAPGIDDAAGIMTLGAPMIVMGHTRHIAWGDTTTGADTQDLYLEKPNPDNPDEYLYMGKSRPFEIRNEIISYREDGEMKEVEIEIRSSMHGPIINEIAEPPISSATPLALQWTGYQTSDMIRTGDIILKAKGWDEFREGLSHFTTPVWNWVYADSSGAIGYQLAGTIPIRKKGRGLLPVPGWTGEYEWENYVPYDEMPRLLNPSNGYIVTANNAVTPDDYPYLISTRFAPPYRASRIEELILAKDKLSVEDMRRIQMDVRSKRGERLRDMFVAACEKHPQPGRDFERALELMRDWDLEADAESRGAAIFYESHATIARNIFGNRVGPDLWKQLYRVIGNLDDMMEAEAAEKWFDDPATDRVETREETIAVGVADAVASLREFFRDGPDAWKWGGMHTLTFKHPLGRSGILAKILNIGPHPIGGAMSTVNPGIYFFNSDQKPYAVWAGPSMRTVVDFASVDSTEMIITLGQSGHRFSRHYSDQLTHWLKGTSVPIGQQNSKEESHPEGRLILRPAPE